jgi:hypothetical protein
MKLSSSKFQGENVLVFPKPKGEWTDLGRRLGVLVSHSFGWLPGHPRRGERTRPAFYLHHA